MEEDDDDKAEVVGWTNFPKPPKLPADPKEKVLAVTAYLEELDDNLSLADIARVHPKWFYGQFLKPLLPKESKIDITGEVLTEVQIEARIQHLVAQLGPEVIQTYVQDRNTTRTRAIAGGEGEKSLQEQMEDILS